QLALCGHGHANQLYDWEGIPGVMARSNLRAKDTIGGYNIITVADGKATFRVRRPLSHTEESWLQVPLKNHHFALETKSYKRPDFSANDKYADRVKVAWSFQDDSDLGAGFARYKNTVITGNTSGKVYALDLTSGQKVWEYTTGGKVYSTPAVWKNTVVVGSSDHYIYGIDAKHGRLKWNIETGKAVLGSPVVEKGIAFIGGSDGSFKAIDIQKGKVKWSFDKLKGYVS